MKNCPNCKRELPEEATFCPYCMQKFAGETNAAPNGAPPNQAAQAKPKKPPYWLIGTGAGAVLVAGVVLFFALRGGGGAPAGSSAVSGSDADAAAGQQAVVVPESGNQSGVKVGDSVISWANMKMDNPDLNLTPQQLAVVKYFDNDYFSVYNYDALQRYPKAYRGAQVKVSGTVEKILQADDDTFECLVSMGRIHPDSPGGNPIVVRGNQPAQARIAEGDVYAFYGRFIDIQSDGSGQYPLITANYFVPTTVMGDLDRFSLQDIETVAKMVLGDDVKIREPVEGQDFNLDALHIPQYFFYLATPGNQTNDNFSSFEFSRMEGMVRDSRSTLDLERTFNMAADFAHYYLSIYDRKLNLFYLECYDRDYKKVWGREFHNVDTVPYDYTSDVIYLVADNDLYIIDAKTGEDKQAPVMVGQKVKVNLLPDGAILVGLGAKDNLMKVDLEGNIVWKASADIDVTGCWMLQIIDGRVVAHLAHYQLLDSGNLQDYAEKMAVVDENGTLVLEFSSNYAADLEAALHASDTSGSTAAPPQTSTSSLGTAVVDAGAGSGLNLRAQPSTDAESYTQIPTGETVTVLDAVSVDAYWWYKVKYMDYIGYVRADYVVMT